MELKLPGNMKPWQLAVIALAVILIGWQVVASFVEAQRQKDVKNDPGQPTIVGAPGSTRAQQEAEK